MTKKKSTLSAGHIKDKLLKKSAKAKSKVLQDAPDDHCFVLCSGQVVKNVKDLADLLETVDDGVFWHHVNSERNDFATWIKDIFQDEALANELAPVKDKKDIRIIIYRYLLNCVKGAK